MEKFAQGNFVQLDVFFYDREGGNLVDPDGYPDTEPSVSVYNQFGVCLVNSELVSQTYYDGKGRMGIGHYSYKYHLADDAPVGNQWHFKWNVTINGVLLSESERTEYFEVVEAGYVDFNGPVTPDEVRALLECYGITSTILSDDWIKARIVNFIVPFVERITRQTFGSQTTITEYHSGNGKSVLILDRKPIVQVLEVSYVLGGNTQRILNLAMIETINAQGILKAKTNYDEAFLLPLFSKGDQNIKIKYVAGTYDYPRPIKEAITYFAAEQGLGLIAGRTGGGDLNVQGYNRNYGDRGKYTHIRNDLARQGHSLLRPYITSVVGA